MENIFQAEVTQKYIDRINQLTPETQPKWGKMDVAQMLAHCSGPYEYVFEPEKFKPLKGPKAWLVKKLVKPLIVSPKPYKKNSRTTPDFKQVDPKDFELEKKRLIDFLKKTAEKGESYFDGKKSFSFGELTKEEWNTMFVKHLDHHFEQFGV